MEQYIKGFKGFTPVKMCGLSPLASFYPAAKIDPMVDYISGHKQFDVASAISNFTKFSLNVFLRLEQLKQNQRTFRSVDGDFIKSNRTKNARKMLLYLLGLIYYNTIPYSEIFAGKMK